MLAVVTGGFIVWEAHIPSAGGRSGAQVVSVRTHAQARAAFEARRVNAAVLDYRLGEDSVAELCVVSK
jgi:hypothetical protein